MKSMLRLAALAFLIATAAFAGENGESWSRLYRRLPSIEQKYMIMQNIVTLDDPSLEPFLFASLNDLVYGDLVRFRTDRNTYDQWEILTRIIVQELGDIKGQSAAITVWDIAESAETPLLKADAMIALGKMRAIEYAPRIARILRDLNFNVRSDKNAAEIEAYGAVLALGMMKEVLGVEPLFYASIGWYADRVTALASETIPSISEDPTEQIILIMREASNFRHKRYALATAQQTEAPNASKADAAIAALDEGLKYADTDLTRRNELARLRKEAITALINLQTTSPQAASLLSRAIAEGDVDEKLIAIRALGLDGGDEAADVLVSQLNFFNDRQASGLSLNQEEISIVRQIVFAMGESGNEKAITPLSEMSFLDYTPALVRQAEGAIKKIQGN